MTDPFWAQTATNPAEATPPESSRRPGARASGDPNRTATRRDWLREPKSAVWMALAVIVLIGGGRRLLWAWRARKAVSRLSDPAVTAEELEAVAKYGRAGAWELLRIFSTTDSEPARKAAGRSLARLWRDDELVAEEEQALVRRGFSVTWNARRRYPRALKAPIPIGVTYDVPFLPDEPEYVRGADLEWSYRIIGARRAALEEFSTWQAGRGDVTFSIIPDDFPTNGPHRLILQAKVRTAGLSDAWEIELPHVPFQFDFDPVLRLEAILALPDAVRDEAISRSVRLERAPTVDADPPRLVPLGGEWVLRNPPRLAVESPLASDLAHQVSIEFEGGPGRYPAGTLVLGGQGLAHRGGLPTAREIRRFDVGPISALPDGLIDRPGMRRMRVHLSADPELGWAHPDIRSVWPGEVETNWAEVEIIRR
jgi:hypothetical protein